MPIAPEPTSFAGVRALKRVKETAEVAMLCGVLDWTRGHLLQGTDAVGEGFVDTGVPLGGTGCPVVKEFAAYELAAVLSMTADSGCLLIGRVLELSCRLPKLWARVQGLEVAVWRAFKVADATMILSPQGAAHVDRHLAHAAHTCTLAQIDRTVEEAIARFDPVEAERRRVAAGEHRHFDVHTREAQVDGTVEVTGTLDLADALDLEQAVREGAAGLAQAGCTEVLDVRRSIAVGDLARGQATLPLEGGGDGAGPGAGCGRAVTIYAHLNGSNVATVDNTSGGIVLIEQVRSWCGAATRVTIKPVIDLNDRIECPGYEPSDRLREQVQLRDTACVFPSCHRRAKGCDLDHIHEHGCGGATASDNLAPLCRRHHRTKTHSRWRYTSPEPGRYVWHSPAGFTFTVDRRP